MTKIRRNIFWLLFVAILAGRTWSGWLFFCPGRATADYQLLINWSLVKRIARQPFAVFLCVLSWSGLYRFFAIIGIFNLRIGSIILVCCWNFVLSWFLSLIILPAGCGGASPSCQLRGIDDAGWPWWRVDNRGDGGEGLIAGRHFPVANSDQEHFSYFMKRCTVVDR